MKKILQSLLIPLALVLLMGADNQDARFQKVGSKIMCTCGCAEMLLQCDHVGCPNSDQMRQQLKAQVAKTSNNEEVLDWFRGAWGIAAVVEPRTHGFELLAWILPTAGLGLGLLVVVLVIRKWKMQPAPVAAADANLAPDLEALRDRARRETEI